MTESKSPTFLVDCPNCRARVAAVEKGRAERIEVDEDTGEQYGERVLVGACPVCHFVIVGRCGLINFIDYEQYRSCWEWTNAVRLYPEPRKRFTSTRIPRIVRTSLDEADLCVGVGAYNAACVMLGRALEGLCRAELAAKDGTDTPAGERARRKIMLDEGIKELHEQGLIDDRLLEWGQQLKAFRNVAAHPDLENDVSATDARDLRVFAHSIVEYVYDLADRYREFMERLKSDRSGEGGPKFTL